MTDWSVLDVALAWIRDRPVRFFLLCLGLYWVACLIGF